LISGTSGRRRRAAPAQARQSTRVRRVKRTLSDQRRGLFDRSRRRKLRRGRRRRTPENQDNGDGDDATLHADGCGLSMRAETAFNLPRTIRGIHPRSTSSKWFLTDSLQRQDRIRSASRLSTRIDRGGSPEPFRLERLDHAAGVAAADPSKVASCSCVNGTTSLPSARSIAEMIHFACAVRSNGSRCRRSTGRSGPACSRRSARTRCAVSRILSWRHRAFRHAAARTGRRI